jgi:hypothetical protein
LDYTHDVVVEDDENLIQQGVEKLAAVCMNENSKMSVSYM